MSRRLPSKRNYSAIKLEEVMRLIGRETFTRWQLNASPRPQSDFLREDLRRLNVFELENSEQANAKNIP